MSPAAARRRARFPGVRAPKPLLPTERERQLTDRQRQVLDELEKRVTAEAEGLADLTMAEMAAMANCSLRTLYEISPSKDELVLTVVDRLLHRIGRRAVDALAAHKKPLDALRAYLRAANEAVRPTTAAFSREFAAVPGARRLLDAHEDYVIAVTQSLLERAAAEGEIEPIDGAAVAHLLGGLGREFSRPEVDALTAAPPNVTADALADLVLRGLERH